MEHYELLLLSVALGMDAFTVAISEGIRMKTLTPSHALKVALFFGLFQALMPMLGYLLGITVDEYIENIDHWVALGLLCFIGIRMIRESIRMKPDCAGRSSPQISDTRTLLVLALATSIDALAAGVSLAIQHAPIFPCAATIGGITALMCFVGVMIGHRVGCLFQRRAELLGGVMLILIGVNILLEHLLP